MSKNKILIPILFVFLSIVFMSSIAKADKVCVRSRLTATNRIRMRKVVIPSTSSCATGFLELVDTASLTGPAGTSGATGATGATGNDGQDGTLRVYGNGNLGDATILNGESIIQNGMYVNFTVDAGATVSARSGTIVRATGDCIINGTLNVGTFAAGGLRTGIFSGITDKVDKDPHPGQSLVAASRGEISSTGTVAIGGKGGLGFGSGLAFDSGRNLIRPGNFGGGGGGASYVGSPIATEAGSGGGTIVFICQNSITVSATGTINANGATSTVEAGGGGGGGIVVLATPGNLTNQGTVNAVGGSGINALTGLVGSANSAGSGGGGGGMVFSIYNGTLTNTGTINVNGGTGGTSNTPTVTTNYVAGSGGGGSYGNGGIGGQASSSDLAAGTSGSSGGSVFLVADPASLF